MVECDYCGDEFDDELDLHLHWGEEHEDEINSHEKDKVKKARRKKEEQEEARMKDRKKYAGYALTGVLAVVFLAFVGPQVVQMIGAGDDVEMEELEAELDLEERPVLGDRDADVTVIEFGDYLCPACRSFEHRTKEPLKNTGYFQEGSGVSFYYVHLPVVDPTGSTNAAAAAECVAEQDQEQYWDYHGALFQNQQNINYNTQGLVNLAEQSTEGLDYEQLEACISNGDTRERVSDDQSFAHNNGFRSTPTVLVNGQVVHDRSYDNMVQLIEGELDQAE